MDLERKDSKLPKILGALSPLFVLASFAFLFAPILVNPDDSFNLISLIAHWSTWVLLAFIFAGFSFGIAGFFKKELNIVGTFFDLLAICFLLLTRQFFISSHVEVFYPDYDWGAIVSLVFLSLSTAFSLIPSFADGHFSIRDIVEDGLLIAVAFGLNFLKVFQFPGGGSINFQMLPLMLIALRHGPFQAFVSAGLIFASMTCLTDGWGFASFPFDYLIGFGSVAIMGFWKNLIFPKDVKTYSLKGETFLLISGILATFVRFVGGVSSSIIVYGSNFVFALIYNAPYVFVSGAIAIAVLMGIYGPLAKINIRFPSSASR